MRIERFPILNAWFHRVFPTVLPREPLGLNSTCYLVRPPENAECANRFAYWSYLERENTIDANVDTGTSKNVGRFSSCKPNPECGTSQSNKHDAKTGLAGAPLGDIPVAHTQTLPPQRAPQRTTPIHTPGVLGTEMDIIA